MNIQWYPGHMTRAKRKIAEDLKLVDVVIELVDARIPMSSRNPDVDQIVGGKPRIIVLNKSDLSDENANRLWIRYYTSNNTKVILANSIKGTGLKEATTAAKLLMKEKIDRLKSKGLLVKTIRALIIGIPNVGKSTLINKMAGRAVAQTGDRPGVTKAKQWIKINPELELLDTPGILWPKFKDEQVALNLAFTGAIKDDILDVYELGIKLLERFQKDFFNNLKEKYKLDDSHKEMSVYDLFNEIGKKRGCMIAGGEIDIRRVAVLLLDDFRGGRIGKITLELPPEKEELPTEKVE
ncbi:MAG: ribosome biosis GTP-binding protein YlqF [Clostridia bacterium]|nr:ribosome biosis GTP-binding protein YlqF [Clostridia bacterium]